MSGHPSVSPRDKETLRHTWFEMGRSLGLFDDELEAFLEAKWGVADTDELTSEQLEEDAEFFRIVASMGGTRLRNQVQS